MYFKADVRRVLPLSAQDRLRSLKERLAPSRRRARRDREVERAARDALAEKVSPNGRVVAGVFHGLRMPLDTSWGSAAPYLAGSYEEELQPWVERLVDREPSVVVDIGSAEGYYAVGLARLLPEADVYAFDVDPAAQRASKRTARLNGTDNVQVRGRIDHRALQRTLVPGALVVSDCEGYELHVLNPGEVPLLRDAYILVELHDMADPATSATLVERFSATHDIHLIDQETRSPDGRPELEHLRREEVRRILEEDRKGPPMRWAVMLPRSASRPTDTC